MSRMGDESNNPLTATDENQTNSMTTWEKFAVPIVFTIFVVFRAADRVFNFAISKYLGGGSYQSVFSNIIWPFAMQFITLCMVSIYVAEQRRQGNKQYDCKFFLLGNKNASAKGAIPAYRLGLFSLFDQLNAAIQAPAQPFVSQPIQTVLGQFVLVYTALVGWIWIKVRFKTVHYIGMALVIVAALLQFAPFIIDNDCAVDFPDKEIHLTCFQAYHSNTGGKNGEWIRMKGLQMAFFYALFVVGSFPTAVGNVYKQKVLQDVSADIFYVSWWSGMFQVLWGWMCIPILWVQLPGQDPVAPKDTFNVLSETFQCLSGHDPDGNHPSCEAGSTSPWVYVILYFAFNAAFNLCITWLTKRISATWVQVASVCCLNLCNILSTQRWLVGSAASPMTSWDWAAAIATTIAMWIYNLQPEVMADAKVADGEAM